MSFGNARDSKMDYNISVKIVEENIRKNIEMNTKKKDMKKGKIIEWRTMNV